MPAHALTEFPVARFHLHATVRRTLRLPDFSGSMLRGAFGHALKRQVCVTGLDDCQSCPLYRTCAYPAIFETPPPEDDWRVYSHIPNPYVVEPPLDGIQTFHPGQNLAFDLVLIGPALAHVSLIMLAWRSALNGGLGLAHRGSATLDRVCSEEGDVVLDLVNGRLQGEILPRRVPPADALRQISLVFQTPLNLRRAGKDLRQDTITARDLVMAMVRRTSDLIRLQLGGNADFDYAHLNDLASQVEAATELQWQGWTRRSSRQQKTMRIGGLVGRWQLSGPLAPLWPFIYLGQWLHVGKKCSFGLGHYTIEEA